MATYYRIGKEAPTPNEYFTGDIVVGLLDGGDKAWRKAGADLWVEIPVPTEVTEQKRFEEMAKLSNVVTSTFNEVNGGSGFSTGVGSETITPDIARSGLMNVVVVGDSMTAANSGNGSITSITRTNNVATVVCPGHGRGTGQRTRIYNCLDTSFNANNVSVTRIDANTFTYPSVGPDGVTTNLGATKSMQVQSLDVCNDNGYLFWLNVKTGGAIRMVANAGNNGQNSADMLSRYDTDVVSQQAADMVIILTGYNDFPGASYTADQVYDNVVEMVLKSVGKLVVVVSALPWTTGGTNANRSEALKYNRKIRNFCMTQKNVRFADAARYLVDPMNATRFAPLTGMLMADGIHPSPKGAERIAQAIYDAVQYDVPRVSRLVSCSADAYGTDSTNPVITDQAPWTTSGGALAGGATGTAAAGMAITNTGSGTTVASVVSRSDGVGYDQQVVFTPAANNDSVTISAPGYITGRASAGQRLNMLAELTLSGMTGANIKSIEVWVTYQSGNGSHYIAKAQAANAASYPANDGTMTIASLVDAVIPYGTTGIGWNVKITASASGTALTAKFGRLSIEKV